MGRNLFRISIVTQRLIRHTTNAHIFASNLPAHKNAEYVKYKRRNSEILTDEVGEKME